MLSLILLVSVLILVWGSAIPGNKEHAAVGHLLKCEFIWVDRIAVFIAHVLEDVMVELFITSLHIGGFLVDSVTFQLKCFFLLLQVVNVHLNRHQSADLPLAAVLRGDLVLAAAADVSDQSQLSVVEVVLLQQVIEGIHG